LQQLRGLGDLLVDIHGQHEHQTLLKRDEQRDLLDRFADHNPLLDAVSTSFRHWQSLQHEYEQLTQAGNRDQQLDLLRFQVEELEALDVSNDEIQSLGDEHKRLANADRLLEGCQQAVHAIDNDENSLCQDLSRIIGIIQELRSSDPALEPIIELLNGSAIQLDEAGHALRHHLDGLSLDPERLEIIDQRLGMIHDMARKHRIVASELPECQLRLTEELALLEHAEQRLEVLQQEISQAMEDYRRAAENLGKSRRKFAARLGKLVTEAMQPLGMPDSLLAIDIQPQEHFSRFGLDRVEFLVATNPKQPPKPLNKVASGGELSRISLAIQVITATDSSIPTLIFDEVDVGIGGRVAEIVGQKLRELGQRRQVLCVTHLPQVAVQGHQHLFVNKYRGDDNASTTITVLDKQKRQDEIARMLGGIEITKQTRAHAREMIDNAGKGKKVLSAED
jgi:DNA repair protein RecN (Recombination protein N)